MSPTSPVMDTSIVRRIAHPPSEVSPSASQVYGRIRGARTLRDIATPVLPLSAVHHGVQELLSRGVVQVDPPRLSEKVMHHTRIHLAPEASPMGVSQEGDTVVAVLVEEGGAAPVDIAAATGIPVGSILSGVMDLLRADAVTIIGPLWSGDARAAEAVRVAGAAIPPSEGAALVPVGVAVVGPDAPDMLRTMGGHGSDAPYPYVRIHAGPYAVYVWASTECDPVDVRVLGRGSVGITITPGMDAVQADAWVEAMRRVQHPCIIAPDASGVLDRIADTLTEMWGS